MLLRMKVSIETLVTEKHKNNIFNSQAYITFSVNKDFLLQSSELFDRSMHTPLWINFGFTT